MWLSKCSYQSERWAIGQIRIDKLGAVQHIGPSGIEESIVVNLHTTGEIAASRDGGLNRIFAYKSVIKTEGIQYVGRNAIHTDLDFIKGFGQLGSNGNGLLTVIVSGTQQVQFQCLYFLHIASFHFLLHSFQEGFQPETFQYIDIQQRSVADFIYKSCCLPTGVSAVYITYGSYLIPNQIGRNYTAERSGVRDVSIQNITDSLVIGKYFDQGIRHIVYDTSIAHQRNSPAGCPCLSTIGRG